MKLNQNDKDNLIRMITNGIEITAKVIVKGLVGFVKALIDAFR